MFQPPPCCKTGFYVNDNCGCAVSSSIFIIIFGNLSLSLHSIIMLQICAKGLGEACVRWGHWGGLTKSTCAPGFRCVIRSFIHHVGHGVCMQGKVLFKYYVVLKALTTGLKCLQNGECNTCTCTVPKIKKS